MSGGDWEESEARGRGAGRIRAAVLSGGVAFAVCLAVLVATPADTYWINDCGKASHSFARSRCQRFATASLDSFMRTATSR